MKTFVSEGRKNNHLCRHQRERYNPFSKQEDMKMLTLNDFAESLRDVCPERILLSAVPKPDLDFVTDLVKQRKYQVPENLCSVYEWISKSLNVEDFFANLFVYMSKEKISKIKLLTRGQNNNKLWYNYRKGVTTASNSFCFDQKEQDFETHRWLC